VAGENLSQIQNATEDAQEQWPIITSNQSTFSEITQSGLKVFPNPASKEIYLSNLKPGENYEVLNTLGQVVGIEKEVIDSQMQRINTSNLRKGIYLIKPSKGKIVRFVIE